ncbi:Nif3-like dinuclear metal center hexameric protein [Chitinophaga pendula]|uniref:Nif3-like dinuclear metal center hexameric protein n=2 Tax=Chitinophaga TaxID=79328 RepID=UPI0018DEFFD6|nr:Nif3-like dinuclear metal center hexameric protein [Chitinophaga sp. MD30]UCJ10277.1 Nif3-like dinuclear metal center hexameric protein [Chitinophaga pendula]
MQHMEKEESTHPQWGRRTFITNVMKTAGIAALLKVPGLTIAAGKQPLPNTYTVKDVIDLILREIPNAPFPNTVDTLKNGNPDQKVTGIITTMFPTVKVIEEAVKRKANFIIAHEPTFYNHLDDKNWVPGSSVVKEKEALLNKYNIAVWRFHDYWHAYRPDGIGYGVLKQTGWLQYWKPGEVTVHIPARPLQAIASHLKRTLGIQQVRVLGNLAQSCSSVTFLPGAAGGQTQMRFAEQEKPDLLIVGELHEWETAEYIRDARQLGHKTALIVLGHSVSEEPGMYWLQEWLQPKITGITVTHIPSGNPFVWI